MATPIFQKIKENTYWWIEKLTILKKDEVTQFLEIISKIKCIDMRSDIICKIN